MLGWDFGDILHYAMLCGGLVFIGLAGRHGSIVFRLLFKEGHGPKDKTLKLLRRISVIGILVVIVCAIVSRILYFTGAK